MSLLEHDLKRGAQTMDQYLHKQALSAAKIAEESRWEYIAMILLEKKQSVIMGIAVEQIKKHTIRYHLYDFSSHSSLHCGINLRFQV